MAIKVYMLVIHYKYLQIQPLTLTGVRDRILSGSQSYTQSHVSIQHLEGYFAQISPSFCKSEFPLRVLKQSNCLYKTCRRVPRPGFTKAKHLYCAIANYWRARGAKERKCIERKTEVRRGNRYGLRVGLWGRCEVIWSWIGG